jgi:N-acetylglutamate synthase
MLQFTIRQIEEISLNAWPAHRQQLYDGWLLRFSEGYTKRANCIMPVYESVLPLAEKIDFCEAFYHHMRQPPIFRLTPLAGDTLDITLAVRGYRKLDPTRVMTLGLSGWQPPRPLKLTLRELPLEQWMGVFSEMSGSLVAKQPAHTQILRNILAPCLTVALELDGHWAACGLGVLEQGWFGLFDIVTHPMYRRQGFATELVCGMLAWAQSQGAEQSYLQVTEINEPARALYARLGYLDAYGYWYRLPD